MHLLYIDEYGTSGGPLDNPNERYFSLTVALVDERHWRGLECDILALRNEAADELRERNPRWVQPEKFEFHAVELLQGKRAFQGLPIPRQHHYAVELLKIGLRHNVKYSVLSIDKLELHRPYVFMRERLEAWKHDHTFLPAGFPIDRVHNIVSQRISPYTVAFALALLSANSYLASRGKRGLLIIDETSQHKKLANLHAYGELRSTTQHITHIVAAPFFVSSHIHAPMQLADLVSYLVGRHKSAMIRGQPVKPPIIDEWLGEYVMPQTMNRGRAGFSGEEHRSLAAPILREFAPNPPADSPHGLRIADMADYLTDAFLGALVAERK